MFFVGFSSTLMILLGVVFGDDVTYDEIDNFIRAIERRDFLGIKKLAESIDVDRIHPRYLYKFLYVAVYRGDAEITRLLISTGWYGVDSNVNRFGYMLLYFVCREKIQNKDGAYEIMEALLKAGANTTVRDHGNAAQSELLNIVKDKCLARLLISYGADVDGKSFMDRTSSHWSLLHNNWGVLKALADGGANFSLADRNGDTMFHLCRPKFGLRMTKEISMFLARKGAPLETLNQSGETPLTKFLKLDAQMDHIPHFNWRPHPSRSDCDESKYNSNLSYGNLNDSFYACMFTAGADINRPNGMGERLIHIAVREFEVDLVRWLLENGADIDCKNGNGDTPLLALSKFLDPDYLEDVSSRTHLPVTKRVVFIKAVMEVLVNGGADVKATDEAGHDALHYLEKSNLSYIDNEILHLLIKE